MTVTEEQIIEGNCIIAKFMGGEYRELLIERAIYTNGVPKVWFFSREMNYIGWAQGYFPVHRLAYHKLWEWLIPAYENARKECDTLSEDLLWYGMMERTGVKMHRWHMDDAMRSFDKLKLHTAVCNTIKFINEHPSK